MAEWDNAHFLTKGVDLSPTFGSYATLIEQAIEQAIPSSTWYGPVIVAEDTPPVLGAYTWHKRALWIKKSTSRVYYYNDIAGSWDYFEGLLDLLSLIVDGSIPLAKLSTTGTAARRVLRRNSLNTAYEWVDPVTIYNAGEFPLAKLVVAAGADYFLLSDSLGTYQSASFATKFTSSLGSANIALTKIKDTTSIAQPYQVIYFDTTGGYAGVSNVIDLISANTLPRNLLKWDTQTVLSTSGALTIDGNTSGCWYHVLTENTTVTVAGHEGQTITLLIKQGASVTKTVAYNGVKWTGGTVPTMTNAVNAVDVMTFIIVNGVVYGSYIQDLK